MSPLQITMLLHIGTIAAELPNMEYPAQQEAIRLFTVNGCIMATNNKRYVSGYMLTGKGEYLMRILTSIPME